MSPEMPSSTLPLVSVGLPTFNRRATIERAIESVLAQDYPNIQLVISDNASTDGTASLCQKYADSDRRVRLMVQTMNRGPAANFLEVLNQSRGELFMWLGDDDWLDPNYVRSCVEALLRDRSLTLVGGEAKYYREGALLAAGKSTDLMQDSPFLRVLRYYASVGDNGIFYGVMRRDIVLQNHCRNCMGSDWLFVAGMAHKGKVKTLGTTSVHRDLGGASISHVNLVKTLQLPKFQLAFPFTSIAINASLAIVKRNPIYHHLPRGKRIAFGFAVFMQIMVSKGVIQNFKTVVVWIMRTAIGADNYRRLRNRVTFLK
jgi:glycosyltransferase involved in cell wall biosynthesis